MNEIADFAVKILKQYAEENRTIVRSTSDLSPLEEWLIIKLFNSQQVKIHSIDWEGLEKEFTEIVIRVEEMYPYKQEGNRDSYSDYNQGWSSACDVLSEKAINFFKTKLQDYIK